MARQLPAEEIINRAAIECGLLPSKDPIVDQDETFIQMVGLLNSAGQEMVDLFAWQELVRRYEIAVGTTPEVGVAGSGVYDLPLDFSYMIDQTGWDRGNQVPVGGPLSAQDWTYLEGRDLVSHTIYASFRQVEGKIHLFPKPPPAGLRVTFEYISRNWLREQGSAVPNRDTVAAGSDICLLDPLMMIKFLKLKFLAAKGFDTAGAGLEFETMFNSRTGKNTGAPVLSAAGGGRQFPYLSGYGSVGDTGYGG